MKKLDTTQRGTSGEARAVFISHPCEVELRTRYEMPDGSLAEVMDLWRGDLAAVPAMLVECALDPVCRTFSGVVAVLSSERGSPIGPGETIVALVLRTLGSQIKIARSISP